MPPQKSIIVAAVFVVALVGVICLIWIANPLATDIDVPVVLDAASDFHYEHPTSDALQSPLDSAPPGSTPRAGILDVDGARRLVAGAAVRFQHPLDGHLGFGVVVATSRTGFDVITADHVVAAAKPYSIISSQIDSLVGTENEYRSFKIVVQDPVSDLAYLRVVSTTPPKEHVSLINTDILRDARDIKTWIVRWTNSQLVVESAMAVGRKVARRSANEKAVSYWELDRKIEPGMSGSALIDAHGHLIGIASGNSRENAYYCDERELIKFFLRAGLKIEDWQ